VRLVPRQLLCACWATCFLRNMPPRCAGCGVGALSRPQGCRTGCGPPRPCSGLGRNVWWLYWYVCFAIWVVCVLWGLGVGDLYRFSGVGLVCVFLPRIFHSQSVSFRSQLSHIDSKVRLSAGLVA